MSRYAVLATAVVVVAFGLAIFSTVQTHNTSTKQELAELRARAEAGEVAAEVGLAVRYAFGLRVSQDYSEAARWYRLTAGQGEAAAQFNLG